MQVEEVAAVAVAVFVVEFLLGVVEAILVLCLTLFFLFLLLCCELSPAMLFSDNDDETEEETTFNNAMRIFRI